MTTTIIALVAGIVGGFIGGFSKFLWENWIPGRLKRQRDLEAEQKLLLDHYGAPAVRAIHELQQRIYVIVYKRPRSFKQLSERCEWDYEVQSLSFLVAQCCARLELLRTKIETVNYGELIGRLDLITSTLAGYQSGFPFYRLQQQEIAEVMMLDNANGDPRIMGYAKFLQGLKNADVECWPRLQTWSSSMLEHWLGQLYRLVSLQHALVDALDFLDTQCHWIPENKRRKLNPSEVIAKLLEDKLITAGQADQLRQELQKVPG